MDLAWDESKRQQILRDRGLDFADAGLFFDGRPVITEPSTRGGEERWRSTAIVAERMLTLIWIWRGDAVRVVTMRRAHAKKEGQYRQAYRR